MAINIIKTEKILIAYDIKDETSRKNFHDYLVNDLKAVEIQESVYAFKSTKKVTELRTILKPLINQKSGTKDRIFITILTDNHWAGFNSITDITNL